MASILDYLRSIQINAAEGQRSTNLSNPEALLELVGDLQNDLDALEALVCEALEPASAAPRGCGCAWSACPDKRA